MKEKMKKPVRSKDIGLSHVSKEFADDMEYQVNQYHDAGDVDAQAIHLYHQSKGKRPIPGVHRDPKEGTPFENYVTRGKSGPMKY